MGCATCGKGGSTSRCCLCNQGSNKWSPWGAKRKICWRCKEKQELLIDMRAKENTRVKKLLKGIGE